jgi:hypothetical protein
VKTTNDSFVSTFHPKYTAWGQRIFVSKANNALAEFLKVETTKWIGATEQEIELYSKQHY